MVRSYIRTCAASVVAFGLAATATGASAETAAIPATAPPATPVPAAQIPAAPAQAITPESAAKLAETIDAELRQWFAPTGPSIAYQWDGRPAVTAAGDHFDVVLPELQATTEGGGRAKVGAVRMKLTPATAAAYDVELTVPNTVELLAADGKPNGAITIGSQHFAGRWLPTAGTFVKAEGAYRDVHVISNKDKARLDVGEIIIRDDLTEQPAGRWSGPSGFSISKVAMVDEQGKDVARMGGLTLEATVTGADLARAVALGSQPAAASTPGKEGSREDAQAALRRHLEILHNLFSGASGRLLITDLTAIPPGENGAVTVGNISLHGGIEGLDSGKAALSLGYGHSGLKVEHAPAPPEFLPEKVELAIAATDLPNAGLWSAFTALFESVPPGGNEDQIGAQFALQAVTALTEAASRLQVETLTIETPAAAATIKGEAHFDGKAAMGAVAGFDMVLRGLEAATKQIQSAAGGKVDEETKSTLAMISMIQAFGVPGKDSAGRDIRSYKLDVGADGRILLNGADMSALLQTGSGAEAPSGGTKGAKPGKTAP